MSFGAIAQPIERLQYASFQGQSVEDGAVTSMEILVSF
jgi:hypothetical protein